MSFEYFWELIGVVILFAMGYFVFKKLRKEFGKKDE